MRGLDFLSPVCIVYLLWRTAVKIIPQCLYCCFFIHIVNRHCKINHATANPSAVPNKIFHSTLVEFDCHAVMLQQRVTIRRNLLNMISQHRRIFCDADFFFDSIGQIAHFRPPLLGLLIFAICSDCSLSCPFYLFCFLQFWMLARVLSAAHGIIVNFIGNHFI